MEPRDEGVPTLLEGTICMIHCLFDQNKAFLLILTINTHMKENISSIVVKVSNLVPRTKPFSIAPYRMSLIKLKELKS